MGADAHPSGGCDFCNKPPAECKRLFQGKTGHRICQDCSVIAKDIALEAIAADEKKKADAAKIGAPAPKPEPRKFFSLDDYR